MDKFTHCYLAQVQSEFVIEVPQQPPEMVTNVTNYLEPSPEAPTEGMKKDCEMASPQESMNMDNLAAATAESVQEKTAASPMTTSTQATAASPKAPGQSDVDQKTESADARRELSSLQKKEDLGATFRAAKKAGRRMRLRISVSCLTIGPPVILGGVLLYFLGELRTLWACASCAMAFGILVLMLAILPTDRRVIRGLGVFCSLLGTFMGTQTLVFDAPRVFEEFTKEHCTDCPSGCWLRFVPAGFTAVRGIALLLAAASVAHGVCRLHARELLDRFWVTAGRLYLTIATTVLLTMPSFPYFAATCTSLSDLGSADILEEMYVFGALIYSFG